MANIDLLRKDYFDELSFLASNCGLENFLEHSTQDTWYDVFDNVSIRGYSFHCGVTKGVIEIEDKDFVIKLPFLDDTSGFDYCKVEYRNYVKACEEHIEHHFAQCLFLGEFMDFPVYLMEKVFCDSDFISESIASHYKESLIDEGVTDNEDEYDYDDYDCSSSEAVEHFLSSLWVDYRGFGLFCEDNYINDIHTGNIGISGDRYVIIDYSGYCTVYSMWKEKILPRDWFACVEVN